MGDQMGREMGGETGGEMLMRAGFNKYAKRKA